MNNFKSCVPCVCTGSGRKRVCKEHDIEKYRTQDHGAGGSPVGNLTTIHTNIPAIPIPLLDMAL